MKRDCGPGELIPVKYEVVASKPYSDDEDNFLFSTLAEAEVKFNELRETLHPCSSVGLYIKDKQGYANCVLSHMITVNNQTIIRDRRKEL